jgi:hypothetical protein
MPSRPFVRLGEPLYNDGTYTHFVLPAPVQAVSAHMPFKGHRTVADWYEPGVGFRRAA